MPDVNNSLLRRIACLLLVGGCFIGLVYGWRALFAPRDLASFEGLDVDKQEQIWDAEHVTFEFETHVGKPFVERLCNGDQNELASFLLPEFEAIVPADSAPGNAVLHSGIREQFSAVEQSIAADGPGFCRYLFTVTEMVESPRSGRLRVLHIHPDDENAEEWNLTVLLSVKGMDSHERHVEYESHGHLKFRREGDADIREGAVIARWDIVDQTLRGAEAPLFEEATAQLGLDRFPLPDNWTAPLEFVRQYSAQHAVGDFDGDGDLDLASATADGMCFVFRRDPSGFVDVSRELGILPESDPELRSYLAHWCDVDSDGFPDLLLGSRLYRNLSGERFEPFPENAGIRIKFNPMGATIADYDADGHADIYVLYQRNRNPDRSHTPAWVGDDASGSANQLWRNMGQGQFENVTDAAGAAAGTRHSFAAAWHHANDDLLPDLYVANDFGANSFLINRGDGSFDDEGESAGVADFATSMGVAAGDIDGDGRPEIYVANMFSKMGRRIIDQVSPEDYPVGIHEQLLGSCAGNRLYTQHDGLYVENSAELGINEVGWAYAPAMLDVDGDGDLDIYATCGFMSFDRHKPDG